MTAPRIPQHIASRVSVSLRLSADAARVQAQELRHLGREADADEADLMRQAWLALAIDVEGGLLERLAEDTEIKVAGATTTTAATCIRCHRSFAENDDYHQVAMSGPNSRLFIHSEDCEAAL